MPKLVTNWIKIATSGPTADGRFLKPEWFEEMANNYDPAEYTACIWLDHWRIAGSFGTVKELKVEEDDKKRLCLLAKLQPNMELLYRNKQEWDLFTSIEITENFARSGQAYLTGLAVTDQPASLGTQRLEFSCRGIENNGTHLINTKCPLSAQDIFPQSNEEESLFKSFRRWLLGQENTSVNLKKNVSENMEQTMDNEQLEEIKTHLDNLLAEKFSFIEKNKNEDKEADSADDLGQKLISQVEDLTTQMLELSDKVDNMDKRFSMELQGTEITENTGNKENALKIY